MKNVFFPLDDDGMPGVCPALKPHDDVRVLREDVDDPSLALVAPLRPNKYAYSITHQSIPPVSSIPAM